MKTTPPEMLEATRLTREGRLSEAMLLIRKLLGSDAHAPSHAREPGVSSALPILDVVAEEVVTGILQKQPHVAEPQVSSIGSKTAAKKTRLFGSTQNAAIGDTPKQSAVSDLAPASGTFVSDAFTNAAGTRNYKLYRPSGAAQAPRPLIIMLHGCTQSADDFAAGTRMNFAAEERTCFVAYPEQISAANVSKCWNWFQTGHQTREQGEPSIIAGIARDIMSKHNIDPRRVYVAGLSAGGAAAAVVAHAYPDVFAALGVHSGLACGVARDLPSAMAAMQGRHAPYTPGQQHPIPTIVFHGDQDRTVHPRNGAEIVKGAAGGVIFDQEVEHGSVPGGRRYSRSIQRDRKGKEVIEDWVIDGAGHAWSGGSKAGTFTDPLGPDATTEMLRFFLAHERSDRSTKQ
jgi:poly(hydroxyalkanoate) depolymerase family esterase